MMRDFARDALAGLELGVLGGLVMLAWYMLFAPIVGQPWWTIPNLWASKFLALRALRSPGIATVTGAATLLILCGVTGVLASLALPHNRLCALGVAAALWWLSYSLLWRRIAPELQAYTPQPFLASAYFAYGSVLGYLPHRRNRTQTPETPAA